MGTEGFFDSQLEQSRVKSAIVNAYFSTWSSIMMAVGARTGSRRILYLDLFSGPGRYRDGTPSTPLLILEKAVSDPKLRDNLVVLLNDQNEEYVTTLKAEIDKIPGIDKLKYRPRVENLEVNEQVSEHFKKKDLVPTLAFIDPFGFKGVTLDLLRSVTKDFGCDCIIFFNFNSINRHVDNPLVGEHIDLLFGAERARLIRDALNDPSFRDDREQFIIEQFWAALRDIGLAYVLPFRFASIQGERTSHYLVFATKNFLGYDKMKEIMSESSKKVQQVPMFEYIPAKSGQQMLFELARPLDQLHTDLMDAYTGQTVQFKELYEGHSVGRKFVKSNYKEVLKGLENKGKIVAWREGSAEEKCKRRPIGTFADDVLIRFS